ncbi:MAG TPA: hypothetical protein VNY10_08480 [Roseiarcus sp.]|jgi:hypothetical protein|nr:hypothetical protein [Roseiarcus sp.]
MREQRRKRELRDAQILVSNARLASVHRRVAAEVARLAPASEDQALNWIEAVSKFDSPDRQAGDERR